MDRSIRIRKAIKNDFKNICTLLVKLKLPIEGIEKNIINYFVLEINNQLVGIIGMEIYEQKSLLRSLGIEPEFQNKGYGTLLYNKVIETAKTLQINELYLLTETAEDFFVSKGFSRIAREDVDERVKNSVEFKEVCPESAVCMCLKLKVDRPI